MTEPFQDRWMKEKTGWVAVVLTMIGFVVLVFRQPSAQWMMSHSVEEYLEYMQLTIALAAAFIIPAMFFCGYSLNVTWKKWKK
ncbi:MAG: hypothetical protein ACFFF9_13945 [Candidatus Thorarchaeota archaeon]